MKTTASSIRITITLMALLLSGSHAFSQNNTDGVIPSIPPSPQAVAFNRIGDYQLNNNYGMPDINIPLFEIDFHGYKIPLTLHYEASPVKPGYNYDVTGLGWTLSGNSCVSRTIRDRADEYGRFNNPFALDPFVNKSGSDKRYLDYANELDRMNYQYDSYNIVLPSGRTIPFFMYKMGSEMQFNRMSQDSNVKIVCSYSPNSIDAFTVTDENGVTYNFTLPEKAINIYQNDPNAERNVTWLLTSINIPAKGTIYYQYTVNPVTINTYNLPREPVITVFRLYDSWNEWPNENRFQVRGTFQTQSPRYSMRFLSRIIYGPTTIDFNYSNSYHMNEIVVSDCGQTIRTYTLGMNESALTSLVISGQDNEDRLVYGFTYSLNNPGNYTDYWGNRCDAGPSVNDHFGNSLNNHGLDDLGNFNMFFAYDGIGKDWDGIQEQLSHNGILAQLVANEENDHYYYYKVKLQSTTDGDTRIPTLPNRHGVLTSITYPNGGQTTFNWENHRFPTATAADGNIVYDRRSQRIIEGGGFRIESVINWTADGTIASEDYYRYGFTLGEIIHNNFPLPSLDSLYANNPTLLDTLNHHIGCGEAVVDPNLFTFMSSFSYSLTSSPQAPSTYSYADPQEFRKMLLGEDSFFKNIYNSQTVQGIPMWWEATFSANKFRSLIGGRQPVVYPEITVYHGHPYDPDMCKSKTVYRYDIYKHQYPDYHLGGSYLSTSSQANVPDTAYFEPLFFDFTYPALSCCDYPSDRHQLKTRSDYSYNSASHTWELVSEEKYKYKNHIIKNDGFVFESCISRSNYYPNYNGYVYGQIGFLHPLLNVPLRDFYKPITQKFGKPELSEKSTTTFRSGGSRSIDNIHTEAFSYLYSGVLKERDYTDLYYRIRRDYGTGECDKRDVYSYSGEDNVVLYAGQNNADSLAVVLAEMRSRNMLASPASFESFTEYPWPSMLNGTKTNYKFYGNAILPFKLYESNGEQYEESIEVLSYDSFGNPTELVDLKTGTHSVFIWGTYGRYMIAMIKNATLSQVGNVSQLLTGTSQTRHATLRALLPNAQIQTWDYLPLIGVSSHTDINGQTILYGYDSLGRVKSEKRIVNGISEPEILREHEYNYMNQQYH